MTTKQKIKLERKLPPLALAWHIPWVGFGFFFFWLVGVPMRGICVGWMIARHEVDEWCSEEKEKDNAIE
jgi:hypothetical protein